MVANLSSIPFPNRFAAASSTERAASGSPSLPARLAIAIQKLGLVRISVKNPLEHLTGEWRPRAVSTRREDGRAGQPRRGRRTFRGEVLLNHVQRILDLPPPLLFLLLVRMADVPDDLELGQGQAGRRVARQDDAILLHGVVEPVQLDQGRREAETGLGPGRGRLVRPLDGDGPSQHVVALVGVAQPLVTLTKKDEGPFRQRLQFGVRRQNRLDPIEDRDRPSPLLSSDGRPALEKPQQLRPDPLVGQTSITVSASGSRAD